MKMNGCRGNKKMSHTPVIKKKTIHSKFHAGVILIVLQENIFVQEL